MATKAIPVNVGALKVEAQNLGIDTTDLHDATDLQQAIAEKREELSKQQMTENPAPAIKFTPKAPTARTYTHQEYLDYEEEHGKLDGDILEAYLAEMNQLYKCTIQVLDPRQQSKPGDTFTVVNRYLQHINRVIPYDPNYMENDWVLPKVLINHLNSLIWFKVETVQRKNQSEFDSYQEVVPKPQFRVTIIRPLTEDDITDYNNAPNELNDQPHMGF